MHPADIKAKLQKKGLNGKWLAADLGVHEATVSRVISGSNTSRRIATRISTLIGMPITRIWPGRYDRAPMRKAA